MWQANIQENNNMVSIRAYTPDDFAAVYHVNQISDEFHWREESMRDCLSNSAHFCWVLEIDNQIEAFIIVSVAAQESEIWNLCVAPHVQRRGYASLLLKHALAFVKEKGAQMMFLEVRVSNKAAQALYQAFGFNEFSIRKNYYRYHGDTREDALVFALNL